MPTFTTEFIERLQKHPHLIERFESILNIVEDTSGNAKTANQAEQMVIDELQRLGNEALHGWADVKEKQNVDLFKQTNETATGHGKKK